MKKDLRVRIIRNGKLHEVIIHASDIEEFKANNRRFLYPEEKIDA